ncbi:MAG TPA: FAD:protein FMN transferase [Bacteroidales bacterium]|nr:FAD:protein FMN transferase [Bacteroidales bacterium]HRW94719.1 FAD:protein FMN transferase [Bacteroidales bacterium]
MKQNILISLLLFAFILALTGCSPAGKFKNTNGVVMGYSYKIVYQVPTYAPWTFESDLRRAARRQAHLIDKSLSLYHKSSVINNVNSNKDLTTDSVFTAVITKAKEIAEKTGAYLNTTTKPLQDLWGYNMSNYQNVTTEDIASVLEYTGLWKVHLDKGKIIKEDPRIQLNLNTIGIGYAIDKLGALLDNRNISNYMIEVGKVVFCKGLNPSGSPWRIIIDDNNTDVIYLSDKAMAIAGGLTNFRTKEGKIINTLFNSRTGYPLEDPLISTLVVSETCLDAAAYSVAFYSMGLEKSIRFIETQSDIQAILYYFQDDQITKYTTTNITPRHELQYFP